MYFILRSRWWQVQLLFIHVSADFKCRLSWMKQVYTENKCTVVGQVRCRQLVQTLEDNHRQLDTSTKRQPVSGVKVRQRWSDVVETSWLRSQRAAEYWTTCSFCSSLSLTPRIQETAAKIETADKKRMRERTSLLIL